jgi:hypothetical protein
MLSISWRAKIRGRSDAEKVSELGPGEFLANVRAM